MFSVNHPYRTTFDNLSAYYGGSAGAALADGNYAYAAHLSDDNPAIKASALVMLGNPEKGIELMRHLPLTPDLRFYRAIGNWYLGNTAEALRDVGHLNGVNLSEDQHDCLDLIRGRLINVLLINREIDEKVFMGSPQINVMTAGFSYSDDIRLTLEDDALSLIKRLEAASFQPDLAIVYRPEYMLLPRGLEELPCPKIAFVSDYDLHVYQKYADFIRFDAFVVYSGVDHYELARLTGKPVFTHVLSHSVPCAAPNSAKAAERYYDIHVTGSSFRRFFADKSALLYQLTQLDEGLEIRIDDGFVSPSNYRHTLDDTRIVPTFVRFYGCFPTRGIEALVHGAAVLYQEGGVLESFLTPYRDNIHPYSEDADLAALEQLVASALEENTTSEGNDGYDLFVTSRSVPMFVKFCAVVSKLISRKVQPSGSHFRRDLCVVGIDDLHGGIARGLTGEEHCRNFERMIEYNLALPRTPQTLNSSAILSIYWLMHLERGLTWYRPGLKERLVNQAITIWTTACELFPAHLVIRFNLARTCFHHGDSGKAEALFKEIVNDYKESELDPLNDDIMSALFFYEDYFPYRTYIDSIISSTPDETTNLRLKGIIAGTSAWYCALISERSGDYAWAITNARQALDIDPENHLARKVLCTLLMKTLPHDPSERLCRELTKDFEECVSGYVLNLHDGFPEYLDLLIRAGSIDQAGAAARAWSWFFFRVRRNGELLPMDRNFFDSLVKHIELMPPRAQKVLMHVDHCLRTGELLNDSDELAEEVMAMLARHPDIMESFVSGIFSGRIAIQRKDTIRIVARRLLKSGRRTLGLACYVRYFRSVLSDSNRLSTAGVFHELMECVAEILQLYPRAFLAARFVRQRMLRLFRGHYA